jgi:hypothetical protein
VTQTRLCITIEFRAPFGLPDTLQGTVGIRHLLILILLNKLDLQV